MGRYKKAIERDRGQKLSPMQLKNFSPYPEDWQHHNILTSVTDPRGFVKTLKRPTRIPLKQAERTLEREVERILQQNDNKVYLIRCETGLGKTRQLETLQGYTLAFPTHALKEEVSERMQVPHTCTPKVPAFEDEGIQRDLEYLYLIGNTQGASTLLGSVARNRFSEYTPSDVNQARGYLNACSKASRSTDTVLTTHHRALFGEFQSSTLIFDEDPLGCMLKTASVDIQDIEKLKGNPRLDLFGKEKGMREQISALARELRSNTPGVVSATPTFPFNVNDWIENLHGQNANTNVVDFFNSCFLYRDLDVPDRVHYVRKSRLPEDKKIIVMSATAPVHLYERLFGDRLEVVDITHVELQGQVLQNTYKSYSRSSFRSSQKKDIHELCADKPVITFKEFSGSIDGADTRIVLHNCQGYDELSGKDLVVLGTPHFAPVVYLLMAKALGISFTTAEAAME